MPKDVDFTDATGTRLGARYRPVDTAGVYVPGANLVEYATNGGAPGDTVLGSLPGKIGFLLSG